MARHDFPLWLDVPPVPAELLERAALRNAVADVMHQPRFFFPSEEDTMNDRDCAPYPPGQILAHDFPSPCPESTKATLKRLRREAKRIRKEIAAVKKQAKRNAKAEAAALAKAKRMRADHADAVATFRAIATDTYSRDKDRLAAAELLINYTQEY